MPPSTDPNKNHRRGRRSHDRMHRPAPGSWEDRSIEGFNIRHNQSRSTYLNRRKLGLGPREVQPMPGGKIVSTEESEREYDRRHSRGPEPLEREESKS
jgi:hypothetical protein